VQRNRQGKLLMTYPSKSNILAVDGIESPATIPASVALKYAIKNIASKWGPNKGPTIDKLIIRLTNLQAYLSELINQKNKFKGQLVANATMMSRGKIRIVDNTQLIDMTQINQDINTALADAQSMNVDEISKIQRAMELGDGVRDIEPILFFDYRRGDQISGKMSKEAAEATALRATINTIKNLLEEEKRAP